MSIINARTRTLALAIVSALSLTGCLGDGSKSQTTPTVANPAPQPTSPPTSTVIQNLTQGTWHFAISAYTKNGVESSRSNVVSKVIG